MVRLITTPLGMRYGPGSSRKRRTTEAVRRAIQLRQESVRALAKRFGVSPTTVQKWCKRSTAVGAPMGPKEPRSTVLTPEEEAMVVAFRRHTLLPLDDRLYGLQPTIPHLTRSSLHRCLERHGISRLPEMEGAKPKTKPFASYAIGEKSSFLLDRRGLRCSRKVGRRDWVPGPLLRFLLTRLICLCGSFEVLGHADSCRKLYSWMSSNGDDKPAGKSIPSARDGSESPGC